MRSTSRVLLLVISFLFSDYVSAQETVESLNMKLPFPDVHWWKVDRAYNMDTHQDSSSGDGHALDFNIGTGGNTDLGIPVLAALDGIVLASTGCSSDILIEQGIGYGCQVWLSHRDERWRTHYAHLTTILVRPGTYVQQGQQIGLLGNTGYSDLGSHLHFSLRPVVSGEAKNSVAPEPMSGCRNFDQNLGTAIACSGQTPLPFVTQYDSARPGNWTEDIVTGSTSACLQEERGFTCQIGSISHKFSVAHRKGLLNTHLRDASKKPSLIAHAEPWNENSEFIHTWGTLENILVQDFHSEDWEEDAVIMYDTFNPEKGAHVIRSGFWLHYWSHGGPQYFGAPTSREEHVENITCIGRGYVVYQRFQKKVMVWNGNATSGVEEYDPGQCDTESQIVRLSEENENNTFFVAGEVEAQTQVGLSVESTLPGDYSWYRLEKNGAQLADNDPSITAYSDSNVGKGEAHFYQITAGYDGVGGVFTSSHVEVVIPKPPEIRGEYFDNMSLSGTPVLVRDDPFPLETPWPSYGSPDPEVVGDEFSVRWSTLEYFEDVTVHFRVHTAGGFRFYLNDELVIDDWDRSGGSYSIGRELELGFHSIVMEYKKSGRRGIAELDWTIRENRDQEREQH